jgi:hypothetical protein
MSAGWGGKFYSTPWQPRAAEDRIANFGTARKVTPE